MVDDARGLQILGYVIQSGVMLNYFILPDIVGYGVVAAEHEVFLQQACVLLGQNEVQAGAVLDRLQNGGLDIAFHIDGRAGKILGAVKNHTDEGNGFACLEVTGAVRCNTGNVVCISQRVCVTAVYHYVFVIGIDLFKDLHGELLGVLTVVRLILVEVGVQIRTESGNGDGFGIVLSVVLSELIVEALVNGCGDTQTEGGIEGLCCSVVASLNRIAVVNGLNCVITHGEATAHRPPLHAGEIEVGEHAEALLCGVSQQIAEAVGTAENVLPLQVVGNLGRHTAVGKAGQTEVDTANAHLGQFVVHSLDVLKGGQRNIHFHGEGQDALGSNRRTEGFDVQRNIGRRIGKGTQNTVLVQIIAVGGCHTHVICAVRIFQALFLCDRFVSQHLIQDAVASGILTLTLHRPRSIGCYGDRGCQVVRIAGTGREDRIYGVEAVQRTAVRAHQGCEGVAFRNDGKEAVTLLQFTVYLGGFDNSGNYISLLIRALFSYHNVNGFFVLLVVIGNVTVHRPTHYLRMLVGDGVVSEVRTVHLAGYVVAVLHVLITDQRAAAVGDHGITGVLVAAGTEVRQHSHGLQLVSGFVETDTVCGKSCFQVAIGIDGVLNRQFEQRRSSIIALISSQVVIVLQFLIGVLGTVGLDNTLNGFQLFGGNRVRAGIDCHSLGSGECRLHFDHLTVGQVGIKGILQGVVGLYLTPLPFVGDVGKNHFLETGFLDPTGNQTGRLFLTHHVLYTNTVFDILVGDLSAKGSLRVAVHGFLCTVIGERNDQLRKQLCFRVIRCLIITGGNIPRIGEENLTGSEILVSDLTGELLIPDLVTVLLTHHNHIRQLGFRTCVVIGHIIDDGVTIFINLIRPCSGNGLDGCGNDSTKGQYQGQDSRCYSFHIHFILSFPPVTFGK